ncbi:MAG: phosphatase PAP2 family protein [Campylobacterota bacterium]|nr:phosphatase PAP2 family protein [Campylobacterota bacterium]
MKNFRSIPLYMLIVFILSSIIFVLFPEIDIYLSTLFYNESFYLKKNELVLFFYYSVKPLLIFLALGGIFLWLYNRYKKKDIFHFHAKELLLVLMTLVIGSGLIVNALLKENWGRARPVHIVEFGGDRTFTPAFILSDQKGNSFSCGHASGAYVLIALALLARKRKGLWMALAVGYGSFVGVARMAAGGHYFSDVVVSFFIMYFTAKITYNLLFDDDS